VIENTPAYITKIVVRMSNPPGVHVVLSQRERCPRVSLVCSSVEKRERQCQGSADGGGLGTRGVLSSVKCIGSRLVARRLSP